jgi:hypothetical protein
VLVSVVSGALTGALALVRTGAAQEATPDALAGHPLVGTWLVLTPGGVTPQTFAADGSTVGAVPPNYVDPMLGLTFQGPLLGQWEAVGER